jgi:hypothetical protein
MNASERLALAYLSSLDLGPVEFEPDGNIPPDFVVGGYIAVEVRRLNQHHVQADGTAQGLEELAIPLMARVEALCERLGPSRDGDCWWVFLRYSRPVGQPKDLIAEMKRALTGFGACTTREACTLQVTAEVRLDLRPASRGRAHFFTFGGASDGDAGGWVLAELARNLQLCIDEKKRKIAPYRDRYREWWLVLDDRIDYGVDDEDRPRFLEDIMPRIRHDFDRIVLLDPRDHRRAFVVAAGPSSEAG